MFFSKLNEGRGDGNFMKHKKKRDERKIGYKRKKQGGSRDFKIGEWHGFIDVSVF